MDRKDSTDESPLWPVGARPVPRAESSYQRDARLPGSKLRLQTRGTTRTPAPRVSVDARSERSLLVGSEDALTPLNPSRMLLLFAVDPGATGVRRMNVEIFTTCVPSSASSQPDYIERVIDVARWSE